LPCANRRDCRSATARTGPGEEPQTTQGRASVRSTGASNVIMLGAEEYANDLGTPGSTSEPSSLNFLSTDPDHNLVVSWHSYNFNTCSSHSCRTSQAGPVIAQVPVIAGEIGENDYADGYVNPLMSWLDSESTSYLAWALERRLQLLVGPGADHRLRRPPHGLRLRLQGAPAQPGWLIAPGRWRPRRRGCPGHAGDLGSRELPVDRRCALLLQQLVGAAERA
jgi:hypothetical protein